MRIRPATQADATAYHALRLRALTEHPEAFGRSADEFAERPLDETVSMLAHTSLTAGDFVLVAEDDTGKLAGMVGIRRESGAKDAHKAFLWGMYVPPEHRGRHVGRQLIETALARTREVPGIEQVVLAVVTSNANARELYRRCGFTSYGIEPHALKLPDGRYLDEDMMIRYL